MRNNCLACKEPISLEDLKAQIASARLHIHYCSNCVKVCSRCQDEKVIWTFHFNYDSPAYKAWKAAGAIFRPRDHSAYSDVCSWCEREIRKSHEAEAARRAEEAKARRIEKRKAELESPETQSLLELMGYGRTG